MGKTALKSFGPIAVGTYLWGIVPYRVQTLLLCFFYMASGPFLIVLNSQILTTMDFRYPALVSAIGLVSSSTIAHGMVALGLVKMERPLTQHFFIRVIVPSGLLSTGCIVLGNSVYAYLSVAYIQMLKALTPVYILLCMFAFRLESPSLLLVFAVLTICTGTSIASYGELRFSVIGFVIQLFGDVVEGLKLVFQDLQMKTIKLTPIETLYYVAPASVLFQFVYILIMEHEAFSMSTGGKFLANHWPVVIAVSLVGFAVNILGYLVMQRTDGLMLKLLSVFRSNALVVLSNMFLPGNDVTKLQWFGNTISVAGFLWYTKLKQKPKVQVVAQGEKDIRV